MADLDDTLLEATSLGAVTTPRSVADSISAPDDVDVYSFTSSAGQTVDFDVDTPQNGPGGLGSFLRLFNSQGQQLAQNNDAAAPGENSVGFDAYLRFTFATGGSYYVAVSNATNTLYDPITGNGDTTGGQNATGDYQLTVQALPVDTDDSGVEATNLGVITPQTISVSGAITPEIDVDVFAIAVGAGDTIEIDIDTPLNGPGGLGSYLRLFDDQSRELASNNDAAAPGEATVGFDSYLRYRFVFGGIYWFGVSNANNRSYDLLTGGGDTPGGLHSIGDYQLHVRRVIEPPPDPDDTLGEATALGAISTSPLIRSDSIAFDPDVDLFRFTASAGQTIDFDLDTTQNGTGGLNSFSRLFSDQGTVIATSDNAAAPGESTVGFDAYHRFTFAAAGSYYLGVSSASNTLYSPLDGGGDAAGGADAIGNYQLTIQTAPAAAPTLSLAISAASIPEIGGTATGTVTRTNSNLGQPLVVNLSSSSAASATVPASVTIPANQPSATFTISAVHSPQQGNFTVTITAAANGFAAAMESLVVMEGRPLWQNPLNPLDVSGDAVVAPIDALLIINYLNAFGSGPVPAGSPPPFFDVNGDNSISPLDALLVINELNRPQSSAPEGEAAVRRAAFVDPFFAELGADQLTRRRRDLRVLAR